MTPPSTSRPIAAPSRVVGERVARSEDWVRELHDLDSGIFFLNAWNGDSILYKSPRGRWSIIDSNKRNGLIPALRFFKFLNIQLDIESVHLTHLHADHYSGISEILDALESRPDEIRIPFGLDVIRQVAESPRYKTKEGRLELKKLLESLEVAKRRGTTLCQVESGLIQLPSGTTICCLLPTRQQLAGVTTSWYLSGVQAIGPPMSAGHHELRQAENELSAVLALEVGGKLVLLTADTPAKNLDQAYPIVSDSSFWRISAHAPEGRPFFKNSALRSPKRLRSALALKLPHHGSGFEPLLPNQIKSILQPKGISVALCGRDEHPTALGLQAAVGRSRIIAISNLPFQEKNRSAKADRERMARATGLLETDPLLARTFQETDNRTGLTIRSYRPNSFEPWRTPSEVSFAGIYKSRKRKNLRLMIRNFYLYTAESGTISWNGSASYSI